MPSTKPVASCPLIVASRFAIGIEKRTADLHSHAAAPVRLGYEKGQDPGRLRTLIRPRQPEFGLVFRAFELADGRGLSLRAILKDLTGRGLRSRRGKPLSVSALWNVLTDPFYSGTVRVGGEWTEGTHQPAASRPRFLRVQERLAARRRSPGRTGGSAQVVQWTLAQDDGTQQKAASLHT